jgi:tetratricopeptide (TPR) repeat protein
MPYVDSALVLQPQNRSVRSLQLRVWAELDRPDELAAAGSDWVSAVPGNPEPYREWSSALVKTGDVGGARRVLEEGTDRIGGIALAQDLAELAALDSDWVAATRHWRTAAGENASLSAAAVTNLTQAPLDARQSIVDEFTRDSEDHLGGRIAADLLVAWSRPGEAWALLDRSLPEDPQRAVSLLRRFADRAALVRSPQGARARGLALERLADLAVGPAAQRARVEAARAFASAGEREAAERMLQRIAQGDGTGPESGANAVSTLIAVMAESGRVEEAEQRFQDWKDRLTVDDAEELRAVIAWAWVRENALDRAEAALEDDSTVSVLAVRGWIALYRGDLLGATELFRGAGPRAGTREEITERTVMLALLQGIGSDSVPAIGKALHHLARGDTAVAVRELEAAAGALPADGGRIGVLLLAGRLAFERGDMETAESDLLRAIASDSASASSPAAAYHLARVYLNIGREDAARDRLETLILAYPESAVVPVARRLLDRLRDGVPQT